jgi:hypothetical protein
MARDPLISVHIVLGQDVIAWLDRLRIEERLINDLNRVCVLHAVKCLANANLVLCRKKWQKTEKFGSQK